MKTKSLVALLLLLGAVLLERAAFRGARSIFALQLSQEGRSATEVGVLIAVVQVIGLAGMAIGGLAALGLGPRGAAAVGLVVAGAGHLAVAAGVPLHVGSGLAALGSGMFEPCLFAAAAATLAWDDESPDAPGPHRLSAVAAFVAAVYAATALGGLAGPMLGSALFSVRPTLVPVLCGALTLLAAAFAGGAAILERVGAKPARAAADAGPYRAAPPPGPPPAPVAAALGGLGILLLTQIGFTAGATTASMPTFGLYRSSAGMRALAVTPIAGLVSTLLVFAVLLVTSVRRTSRSPVALHGLGLLVAALGLVLVALAGDDALVLWVLGVSVTQLGAAAAHAVPVAYAAVAVRGRAAALVTAGWLVVVGLVTSVGTSLGAMPGLRPIVLFTSAVFCVGTGVAILLRAEKLHGAFFAAPPG